MRAALEVRLLVLEEVEKAERNVLPTLNNLLENREMALQDGRFLTNPTRFDGLEDERLRKEAGFLMSLAPQRESCSQKVLKLKELID